MPAGLPLYMEPTEGTPLSGRAERRPARRPLLYVALVTLAVCGVALTASAFAPGDSSLLRRVSLESLEQEVGLEEEVRVGKSGASHKKGVKGHLQNKAKKAGHKGKGKGGKGKGKGSKGSKKHRKGTKSLSSRLHSTKVKGRSAKSKSSATDYITEVRACARVLARAAGRGHARRLILFARAHGAAV